MKTDIVTVRMEPGTLQRIDPVLKGGEVRAAFIRVAVENEIRRRQPAQDKVAKDRVPA